MIPEVVQRVVAAAMPGVDVLVTPRAAETHQSNQLFHLRSSDRHFIAKQYLKEDEWESAPAREHASLQRLEALDIAPRPFFYDAKLGPVVIYEYMEGRMWGRYHPSPEEMQTLALRMAQVHQMPPDELWLAHGSEQSLAQRMAWFTRLLESYAAWSAAHYAPGERAVSLCSSLLDRAGQVLDHLYATMPPLRFCRSDPRFANVIVRPDGRLGFVDWEDAGLRDPALEVADLFLHTEQEDLLTEGDYDTFMAVYTQAMQYDREPFGRRVEEIALVLPLFYIVILMRHGLALADAGKLATWQVNEMPANIRLQRYLARGLEGSLFDFDPAAYADLHFFPTD